MSEVKIIVLEKFNGKKYYSPVLDNGMMFYKKEPGFVGYKKLKTFKAGFYYPENTIDEYVKLYDFETKEQQRKILRDYSKFKVSEYFEIRYFKNLRKARRLTRKFNKRLTKIEEDFVINVSVKSF